MSTWVDQIFRAAAADRGGVVRRSIYDVERMASLEEIIGIARERHFHVLETGDQVVILCNEGELRIHC
ncbi:N-(5'-phosphoribosyl)anthranilate isomerase [Embleya scabrispora]|uniref:N-(5'-phosphoribosyl)anthranilate isomerase n=1 Tax=Embleya TaxID=2699295 RepID=UPI00117FC026|nr:N-(5'-phosphoribosyl)anthranilate isomerase [Embleya scabrispora]